MHDQAKMLEKLSKPNDDSMSQSITQEGQNTHPTGLIVSESVGSLLTLNN